MQKAAEKFSGISLRHGTDNGESTGAVTGDRHAQISQETREILEQEKAALEAFAKENSINTQDEIA